MPTLLGISKAMNDVWYVPDDTKCTISLIYTVAVSLEILVGAKKTQKTKTVLTCKMEFGLGVHYNQFFICFTSDGTLNDARHG